METFNGTLKWNIHVFSGSLNNVSKFKLSMGNLLRRFFFCLELKHFETCVRKCTENAEIFFCKTCKTLDDR
jgi:hypothetical protein